MSNKKINLNREELWKDKYNSFCVRFNDISIQTQQLLAKRIKKTSPIKHTKSTTKGPTPEKIHEYLKEINPIIFAENFSEDSHGINSRLSKSHKRSFGIYNVTTITSERFNDLCSIIYHFSIKENLDKKTLQRCLIQTTKNYYNLDIITNLLEEIRNPIEETQQKLNTKELDIKEIKEIRLKNETNQNLYETPNNTFDLEPENI